MYVDSAISVPYPPYSRESGSASFVNTFHTCSKQRTFLIRSPSCDSTVFSPRITTQPHMDPFSIVASAITVFQAADRLGNLLGKIQPLLCAQNDVLALLNEIGIIRNALEGLQEMASISNPGICLGQTALLEPVSACLLHISGLEDIISESCKKNEKPELKCVDVKRVAWVRKKGELERIKYRLRDALAALQLVIAALNITNQASLSMSVENLGKSLRAFHSCLETSPLLRKHMESSNFSLGMPADATTDDGHNQGQPNETSERSPSISGIPSIPLSHCELVPSIHSNLHTSENRDSVSRLCSESSRRSSCGCNQSEWKRLRILSGILGILLIEWTSQLSGHAECGDEFCTNETIPQISMTFYGPSWITTLAARFSLRMSSPPSVSLSFPQILPPDAEIFICIRMGNINRLKDILIEGRGSVADVLAPYGISTLLLAMLHGQVDVYRLLLSAGASRVPPANMNCPAVHMQRFWGNYISQDYGVTTSEILRDHLYQHSSPHTQKLSGLGGLMISERSSFTRLHKSTLGLTCESLDKILHLCMGEIDATDSLGRTCLHLAAYQTNISAIRILLAQGANPDITDQYGKAPLHVVAALGSYSAAKALVMGGADLEVRDQFGSTPLHHASIIGHHDVAQLLVDGGSNIDSSNYNLETPIRHAILGDHIEVVQLLHRRGAALTLEDKWGGYALQKSVWFNCHRVLKYFLGLGLRLDQRHQVRGTILHTLAELGDLRTMEIFLEIKHYSLANVDPAEVNARGWTAMDYLESRPNAGELREPFLRVLKHVKLARQYNKEESLASLDVDRSLVEEKGDGEQDEFFSDALEFQVQS